MRIFFIIFFVAVSSVLRSQNVTDVLGVGAANQQHWMGSFTVDKDGCIYLYGIGARDLVVNDSTIPSPFGNDTYSYILKLDSAYNLIWHRMFNYRGEPYLRSRICVDNNKNIYITDSHYLNAELDSLYLIPTHGSYGYLTYKLDSMGVIQWVRDFSGFMMRVDDLGYLELYGIVTANDSLGTEALPVDASTPTIAWFDLNGNYTDHFRYNDASYEYARLFDRDKDGNYFGFRRVLPLYQGTPNDLELFKVDSLGNLVQSNLLQTISGTAQPFTMACDPINGGYYFASVLLDRTPLNSSSGTNLMGLKLVKTDENFNVISVLNLGPQNFTSPASWANLLQISVINGDVFVSGKIEGLMPYSWSHFGAQNYLDPQQYKFIIAKLSSNLELKWIRNIPGIHNANSVCPPIVHGGKLLYGGQGMSFIMDSLFCDIPEVGPFLLHIEDLDSTEISLEGEVFYDVDQNGIYSGNDVPVINSRVLNTSFPGYMAFTDVNGQFYCPGITGNQAVKSMDLPLYWQRSTLDSINVSVNITDTVINDLNFGMFPVNGIVDLKIESTSLGAARPGFQVTYLYEVSNIGTDTSDVNVWVNQDASLNFLYSSILHDSISGDSILFIIPQLPPDSTVNILITDSVEANVNLLGTYLFSIGHVFSDTPDTSTIDNIDAVNQIVTGSYDPNDISVHPVCGVTENFIQNDYLEYLIRFQNTGSDTAFNITIRDTLPLNLDFSTLEYVSSSHYASMSVINQELVLFFSNIMLPDSATDIVGSNGFFKFKIKAYPSLWSGSTITNQAAIFFDYNPPIFTNSVTSTVISDSDFVELVITPSSCLIPDGSISYSSTCLMGELSVKIDTGGFNQFYNQTIENLDAGYYSLALTNILDTIWIDSVYVPFADYSINQNVYICPGDSVFLEGAYHGIPGIYTDSHIAINGCDSLINSDLIIHPVSHISHNLFLCEGDSVFIGNSFQTTGGGYQDTLLSSVGCDSIITYNLTFNPLPLVSLPPFSPDSINEYDLPYILTTGSPAGGIYSGTGVVGIMFNPPIAFGNYMIYYTYTDSNSCTASDSSAITVYLTTGIVKNESEGPIRIYPNPTTGIIAIQTTEIVEYVSLFDIAGSIILNQNSGDNLDLSGKIAPGIYLLKVATRDNSYFTRIILQDRY